MPPKKSGTARQLDEEAYQRRYNELTKLFNDLGDLIDRLFSRLEMLKETNEVGNDFEIGRIRQRLRGYIPESIQIKEELEALRKQRSWPLPSL